jgi:hypothetical protein
LILILHNLHNSVDGHLVWDVNTQGEIRESLLSGSTPPPSPYRALFWGLVAAGGTGVRRCLMYRYMGQPPTMTAHAPGYLALHLGSAPITKVDAGLISRVCVVAACRKRVCFEFFGGAGDCS